MVELTLVSGNKRKVGQLLKLLEPDFRVRVLKKEYPEIQHDDPSEISKAAAKMLANRLKKMVVVEDSGLFVPALKNFPGPWTKYSHNTIGNKGILKLMEGVKSRKAYYRSSLGLCAPGRKPVCFTGMEEGVIAHQAKGRKGWGQDPIFVPKGRKRTYGQIGCEKGYYPYREKAVKKLREFLLKT